MAMKNPPHPGKTVKLACLEPLELSIAKGAEILDVSRSTLNRLCAGEIGISPEMAVRLSKAFGSSAEAWLRMQAAYDLAQVKADKINVEKYETA